MSLRIAIIQTGTSQTGAVESESELGLRDQRDALRTRHIGVLRELSAEGTSIAVFPEMADLPFSLMTEKEILLDVATQIRSGEDLFFTELRDLSDKSGMVIVYPSLERDGESLFSSAFIMLPHASRIEVVRKRLRAREEGLFEKDVLGGYSEPGFQVFGNDEFRFAVTLDRGGVFFRTAEMLARDAQASLIINPRAQLHSDSQRILDEELREHARSNGYSLVLANRVGERETVGEAFSGRSQIIGADGAMLAMGSDFQPEVLRAALSLETHLTQVIPGLNVARTLGRGEGQVVELTPKELH